nr:hypothetical protein [Tanacetum cinerariifolium]
MRAFINEFRTTNELLFKERNNSLSELRFEVHELLRVIDNALISNYKVKGVTTRGEKTTQDVQNDNTNMHTEEPLVEKNPGSFTIPCDIGKLHIDNTLADLGVSISLIPYTMYEKLGLGEPTPTRMSLELADRPIQYPKRIFENVLIKVDKFVLPINFVILDMPEDSRSPINLGRPFLATARAMIDVFNKKTTLRAHETIKPDGVESKHLYSTSTNEIDEKKPELKSLLHHLEYAYLHGDKSFPIIISSELSEKEKMSLLQVLEKRKGAIAWKMLDIKGISLSFCTHKILMEDSFKPVTQPQRRLNPKVQDVVKNKIVKLLDSRLIYPISDRFFQILIAPEDQEKKTFTCPYGTFAYRHMFFGLYNIPVTFQRCMTTIFHDMVKDFMEVFMDDFSVFENLAVDHLSRLKNPDLEVFTEEEITDEFPDDHLMVLKAKTNDDEPRYADYVNYIIGKIVPPRWTPKKEEGDVLLETKSLKFWHIAILDKLGVIIVRQLLKKVYKSGFFWHSIFKDAKDYVMRCDACQILGNISSRSEMPQNNIQVCDVFDIWGLDFMGPFLNSRGNKYILAAVDYVSKWVEAQALPMNDTRVVIKFLRRLFLRFGVSMALISDRVSHFCNSQLEKAFISLAYHPQTNGQTKVTNKAIKCTLERTVEITDKKGISFKVNGKRLKKYYDGHIDTDDKEELTGKEIDKVGEVSII